MNKLPRNSALLDHRSCGLWAFGRGKVWRIYCLCWERGIACDCLDFGCSERGNARDFLDLRVCSERGFDPAPSQPRHQICRLHLRVWQPWAAGPPHISKNSSTVQQIHSRRQNVFRLKPSGTKFLEKWSPLEFWQTPKR